MDGMNSEIGILDHLKLLADRTSLVSQHTPLGRGMVVLRHDIVATGQIYFELCERSSEHAMMLHQVRNVMMDETPIGYCLRLQLEVTAATIEG